MDAVISIRNLRKSFDQTEVFQDFSLEINPGKITAILGPNGSGKSTLLNIIAGVTAPDAGSARIANRNRFDFSYIFQNYRESLFPWRTNLNNLAFPLEIQERQADDVTQSILEVQKLLELDLDWNGYPYELSGGQQQILAFARALVTRPKILCMDEPFSALDYENGLRLREKLQKYFLDQRPTVLLVTHDIEEATHLADRILVFSRKPARVLASIENPLPYPRDIQTLKSPEFEEIRNKALSAFQKAIR